MNAHEREVACFTAHENVPAQVSAGQIAATRLCGGDLERLRTAVPAEEPAVARRPLRRSSPRCRRPNSDAGRCDSPSRSS